MEDSPRDSKAIRPVRVQAREEAVRSAATREDWNWGQLARNVGQDTLSGAASGAVVGGVPTGGIGALPGAAIGGATGAAASLFSNMGSRLWYNTRTPQDKAAWLAGDIVEKVVNIAPYIEKANPAFGQQIKDYAQQFQDLIKARLQGVKMDLSKNVYTQYASSKKKLTRVAQQMQNEGAYPWYNQVSTALPGAFGDEAATRSMEKNPAYRAMFDKAKQDYVSKFVQQGMAATPDPAVVGKTAAQLQGELAAEAAKRFMNPSNLKSLGFGFVTDIAANYAVGGALDWADRTIHGEDGVIESNLTDIRETLNLIFTLTYPLDPKISEAGMLFWRNLQTALASYQATKGQPTVQS